MSNVVGDFDFCKVVYNCLCLERANRLKITWPVISELPTTAGPH